ncbi:MAG: thioredoxin domain-containing protein [Cyanobium sp.]
MSAHPDPIASAGTRPLGRIERILLAAVAALLALLLLWLRGGLHPSAPLDRLARQSPDFSTALANGRPTLVEFYADWCEACRAMAPAMETIEQRHRGALDVVLLNVDNPRWQPQLERFAVNGIPQLELFDASGGTVGRSIGARRPEELEALTTALLQGQPLPQLAGVGTTSTLPDLAVPVSLEEAETTASAIGPRSHG